MPLDGENLDELLSGFVDGVLSEAERKLVEEAAQADVRLKQRIYLLQRQASEVGDLGRVLADQARRQRKTLLDQTLAERVIAQARLQAVKAGLPNSHFVHGQVEHARHANAKPNAPITLHRPSTIKHRLLLAGVLSSAAAVLLAVVLSIYSDSHSNNVTDVASTNLSAQVPNADDSQENPRVTTGELPESDLTSSEGSSQLVGQFNQITFVLVADVQITARALRENVLEDLLIKAGIPPAAPVVADESMLKAMDQAQMIVNPPSNPSQRIYVTAIRAEMRQIDKALQDIWKDNIHFPNVSLNLAVDARANLVREVLNGTRGRFSLTDSFAVPLSAQSAQPDIANSSPFPGVPNGVNYVSSSKRSSGWATPETLAEASSGTISTILLVTHVIE